MDENYKNDSIEPTLQLLASSEIEVINLGLTRFADTFEQQDLKFIQVDWRPPADGDQNLADILAALQR